ncbi:hypothetical protein PV10_04061 [Exophiala mesophila]|uniref:ER membrane protein complex subunit 7 beta-sandwich domain-containing protein n=1 Tax=Exophiala mesophila TaxID=212818 RepID=A0A0D1WU77_EXOME|nr:uncharacterized protein PV10_04061 [Exophiala mesophila]KIV92795.1 hypothetical protein PV10_04061 [Exophiala mesophila]
MARLLVFLLTLCQGFILAHTASIRVQIPSSNLIPNPYTLPSSTHATLTSGSGPPLKASLRRGNYFQFDNVTTVGSLLLDVYTRDFVFAPYRIDIAPSADSTGTVIIGAWETYRGTRWEDKGVALVAAPTTDLALSIKALTSKNFYEQRQGFNPMSLLKNPMILMGGVALLFTFGMPKLMENMDPEMKAEYEEMQKKTSMGSVARAMQGGGSNPAEFDIAGYLAGTGKSTGNDRSSGSTRERKR